MRAGYAGALAELRAAQERVLILEEVARRALELVPPAMRHTQAGGELLALLKLAGLEVGF